MTSAGPSWEEAEKENLVWKKSNGGGLNNHNPPKKCVGGGGGTELDTLVTFLSKFDSSVAAIWDEPDGKETVWAPKLPYRQHVREPSPSSPLDLDDDLLVSTKTHFRPIINDDEDDDEGEGLIHITPLFGLSFLQDPAEYATYMPTAEDIFPLRFKLRSDENDKAVQTDSTTSDQYFSRNVTTSSTSTISQKSGGGDLALVLPMDLDASSL